VTIRWPVAASLAALVGGAGLAALVLAFCAEGEDEPGIVRPPTRTPFSRTVTVARTPSSGTLSAVSPSGPTATPSNGGPAPEDTAEVPTAPPEEATPSGETTLPPDETPLAPSPTQPAGTPTPVPPTPTLPAATVTSPLGLPDLVVLDTFVSSDRVGLRLGNKGGGELPAGQEVEFRVRGVTAEKVTLGEALLPGASVEVIFENQVIYRPELLLAVADPNNVIPEEDDDNNGLAKQLAPDVALDLSVHGVFRAVDAPRLRVVIQNPTAAPAIQVTAAVTVFLGDAGEPAAESTYQLTIEPLGFETVEVMGVAALPGTQVRVVVEMTDPPDADPANNVWEGTIS